VEVNEALKSEMQTLWKQSRQLQREGKFSEAIEATQLMLDKERGIYGPSHPELAISLGLLAELQEATTDHGGAETTRTEVLEMLKQAFGEQDWRTTDARLALEELRQRLRLSPDQRHQLQLAEQCDTRAVILKSDGKHREAIPLYLESLQKRRTVLGERHQLVAVSMNNLAAVYHRLDDFSAAESLYQQSGRIAKTVLGDRHPTTAATLNNLAVLYSEHQEYEKAEQFYRECIDICMLSLGEQHPNTIGALNGLGRLHEALGRYEKAEQVFLKVFELQKRMLGEHDSDTAASLNNVARMCQEQGKYSQAKLAYRQSFTITQKAYGEGHPNTATVLNNLAALYVSQAEYAQSMPLYLRSHDIFKSALGEEHPATASSFNNLGWLYESLGDHSNAERYYLAGLAAREKSLGSQHSATATSLNNLAGLYSTQGDFVKAETFNRRALEIYRSVLGERHPRTIKSLSNLAANHFDLGDYAKAKLLCQQALEMRKQVVGEHHPDTATSVHNLAAIHLATGDYSEAESLYNESLEIHRQVFGEMHPSTADISASFANYYLATGEVEKAEPLMRKALRISRKSLDDSAVALSERQQLAMNQMLRHRLDGYLSLALQNAQFQSTAVRETLLWKGATLVRQRAMHQANDNPQIADRFRELQQVTRQLASVSRTVPEESIDGWRERIAELTAKKEAIEAQLSRESAAFRAETQEVTLGQVQAALPDGSILIDYLQFTRLTHVRGAWDRESSLVAMVIPRQGSARLVDLGPIAPLGEAVDIWRQTFGMSPQGIAAGKLLRQRLWEPFMEFINNSDTVLVSTDGVLGRLPFGALPGQVAGQYLLEEHRLAMMPVPQLLPALVNELGRKELSGGLLMIGDVNYDAAPNSEPPQENRKSWKRSNTALVRSSETHFPPLAATAGEVATIRELFTELFDPKPNALKTLKQTGATEQEFRESASQFYNLHIATHGFFAAPDNAPAVITDAPEPNRDR